MVLFCLSCGLMVLSSFFYVVFLMLDRQHEIDIHVSNQIYRDGFITILLDEFVGPMLGWFFALVPMTVCLMTFKFIFFPLSMQNEDQCHAFAKYKAFYTTLHDFVSTNKSDL